MATKNSHWAKYKFQIIKNAKGGKQKFRWRAVSCNGRIVCDSETYTSERGPAKTIESFIQAVKEGNFKVEETLLVENE